MHELTERELYQALEYAKSIDEDAGRKIIEHFQLDQTALAQTIFGIFPNVIAEENQEMSYLFMDLCFDVLCIFQKKPSTPCPLKMTWILIGWKNRRYFWMLNYNH